MANFVPCVYSYPFKLPYKCCLQLQLNLSKPGLYINKNQGIPAMYVNYPAKILHSCLTPFIRHIGITFLIFLLAACAVQTEEERIAAINKRIAPEGHLTKTHLYVEWPAEYESGKEVAKPLKLKIPIEYLNQNLISFENAAKIEQHDSGKKDSKESSVSTINYSSRISDALLIQDNKITSVYLRLLPGAKPYQPMLPYKSDTKDVADFKYNYFKSSYAVIIHRKPSYSYGGFSGTLKGTREADVNGLMRYVETECYDIEKLKKEHAPIDQKRAFDNIASKAKDDHSAANCFEDRSWQHLATPPNTKPEQAVFVTCSSTGCDANFDLKDRDVSIYVSKENTMYQYQEKIAHSEKLHKEIAEAKAANREYVIKPFAQPTLDKVFTDLPKWQEKVEPTRNLLDSFVVYEKNSN